MWRHKRAYPFIFRKTIMQTQSLGLESCVETVFRGPLLRKFEKCWMNLSRTDLVACTATDVCRICFGKVEKIVEARKEINDIEHYIKSGLRNRCIAI